MGPGKGPALPPWLAGPLFFGLVGWAESAVALFRESHHFFSLGGRALYMLEVTGLYALTGALWSLFACALLSFVQRVSGRRWALGTRFCALLSLCPLTLLCVFLSLPLNRKVLPGFFTAVSVGANGALFVSILLLSWPLARLLLRVRAERLSVFLRGRFGVLLLLIAGLSLLVSAGLSISRRAESTPLPDVLLISLDTLRARNLGCYGYARETSPNIDAFAGEGVLFENAVSQSAWTLPSHMSLFTSLYPHVHGVIDPRVRLDPERVTLAEVLRENGYHTAAFVDGEEFNYIGSRYGFDQGFDFYDHHPHEWKPFQRLVLLRPLFYAMGMTRPLRIRHASDTTQTAMRWLGENRKRPFFLFLHYFDIHGGPTRNFYDHPEAYNDLFSRESADSPGSVEGLYGLLPASGSRGGPYLAEVNRALRDGGLQREGVPADSLEALRAHYDGGIRYVDDHIGALLDKIESLSLDEETLVVLTADHGEEFLEHGRFKHRQLYNEVIQVPLILRFPGKLPEGRRIAARVRSIDVLPTVLDLLDLPVPADAQGESLLPLIRGRGEDRELWSGDFSEYNKHICHFDGPWKFILHEPDSITAVPKRELYNLSEDPDETRNLASELPGRARKMEEDLREWMKDSEGLADSLPREKEANREALARWQIEALKELGYLQ